MNRFLKQLVFLTAVFAIATTYSCKKKTIANTSNPLTDTTQTYFSIRGFIKDQVALLYGQPYSLNQFTTENGRTDSTMVNFYNMDLGYVLKTFLSTDISSTKFLGKYKFSSFSEGTTGNRTLMYEAIDPKLFTRTFSLTVDPSNDMILSVYVETAKSEGGDEQHQRLLYVPLKVIQIQEDKSSTFSKMRNLRVEYRFLQ